MSITEKLLAIQTELKAPKNQYNSFGKYNYRSCEDILEGIKPLCAKHKVTVTISDTIEMLGDRFYIKATVTMTDGENFISSTAYARESLNKKGMDESQITGACSSYARKYALNGLFLIDDTKDADTQDNTKQEKEPKEYQEYLEAIKLCTEVDQLTEIAKEIKADKSKIPQSYNNKLLIAWQTQKSSIEKAGK